MPGELVSMTLRQAWIALNDRGVKACLMGGMAMAHWGHARFTRDVDLLVSLDPQSIEDLADVLSKEGFSPRHAPPISRVGKHSFVQLIFTPQGRFDEIPVNLLIADSDFLRAAVHRAVPFVVGGTECNVASCEDLIVLKLQADRLIDRADVRYLLEYNRPALDFPYLTGWIAKLGLNREWDEWWRDAFPDEPAPLRR
jgi:predicted nucleotidyltransferase